MKKLAWAGLIAVILAAGYLIISREQVEEAPARPSTKVKVHEVTTVPYAETLSLIGNARANESAALSVQITEKVAEIPFREGTLVKKGDILLVMEQREEKAATDAARVQLKEAQRNYERARQLSSRQFTSKAAFDNANSALATATTELSAAEARVKDRMIIAPFDGIVGTRSVSVGDLLEPGDIITTIDDITVIKIDMDIPERYLPFIQVGQEFIVTTQAYGKQEFTGKVDVIESRVDPVARTFRMRGSVDNAEGLLRPGMLLEARLQSAQQQVIAIPEGALVPIAKQQYVFVLQPDGKVKRQLISIDRRFDGMVEITEGLAAGDKIVVEGQLKLSDGQAVTLAEETGTSADTVTKASE